MRPKIIFLADSHGYLDDLAVVRKILATQVINAVLAERVQERTLLTPPAMARFLSTKRAADDTAMACLVRLCQRSAVPLYGIDLKNYGMSHALKKALVKPTPAQETKIGRMVRMREKVQLAQVKKLIGLAPLLVIVGAYHLQDHLPLLTWARKYADADLVYVADKDGTMQIEPELPKRNLHVEVRHLR